MGERVLQIVTTEELAETLCITRRQVLVNVRNKRWKPLKELGCKPYRFDLLAIQEQLRGSSLTTESRKVSTPTVKPKPVSIPTSSRKKGDTRKLWQR